MKNIMNLFLAVGLISTGVSAKDATNFNSSSQQEINMQAKSADYFGEKVKKAAKKTKEGIKKVGKNVGKKVKKVSKKAANGAKKAVKGISKISSKALTAISDSDELKQVITTGLTVVEKLMPLTTGVLAYAAAYVPVIGPTVSFALMKATPVLQKITGKISDNIDDITEVAATLANVADSIINPTKIPADMPKAMADEARQEIAEQAKNPVVMAPVATTSDEVEVTEEDIATKGEAYKTILVMYDNLGAFIKQNPNAANKQQVLESLDKANAALEMLGK